MRLFIKNSSGEKKYLDFVASSRKELSDKVGGNYIDIDKNTYHISEVFAESSSESAPASAVIGGAIGLVGGMPGVVIGGLLGALLGNDADQKEKSKINNFNKS